MVSSWTKTPEDRLLDAYLEDNPGLLFLEVEVGGRDGPARPRRIDGILIPGDETVVHRQGDYTERMVAKAVEDRTIHLIEAKVRLNRPVIGQVLAGKRLFERRFSPSNVEEVVVCQRGNEDLEWVCEEQSIRVAIFPSVGLARSARSTPSTAEPSSLQATSPVPQPGDSRAEQRAEPNPSRRRAFFSGWADAVRGKLYETVHTKKTHQTMGNLFGWIYGDQPEDFRRETWKRYVDTLGDVEE